MKELKEKMKTHLAKVFLCLLFFFMNPLLADRIQVMGSSLELLNGVKYHLSAEWMDVKDFSIIQGINFEQRDGKVFSIGYSPKTVVTYLPLEFHVEKAEKYYFIVNFPSIDLLECIIFDAKTKKEIYRKKTGDTFPFFQRQIVSEVFLFPLEIDNQSRELDVILITKTSGSHKLPLKIESLDHYLQESTSQYYLWGLFLGLVITVLVFSIILIYFTKENIFFYYSMYIVSLIFLFHAGFGLGFRFLYPESPFLQDFIFVIVSSLSACFKILFYVNYLKTKKNNLKFYNLLMLYFLILILCTILYIPTKIQLFYSIVLFLGPVCIFSLGLLSFLSIKHNENAIYFLFAEVVVLIGVFISYLNMNGFLPHNFFTYQVFLFSVCLELMILSTALGKTVYSIRVRQRSAEAASVAKGLFLSTMSHEIRTPLNGVLGFLDLLESTELNETQIEYLNNSKNAGKLLMNLLNDILDFSKIEAGKLEIKNEKVNIFEIIHDCLSTMKPDADRRGIELEFIHEQNIPAIIEADFVRLRQVILNLVSNAVKFTEKGKVSILLEFNIINYSKGEYKIEVKDTGIGIKKEDLKRLFHSFSQADSSISRRFGGTGLGLAISSSIVKKMGSRIQVKSKFGEGSIFYFSFLTPFWDLSEFKDPKEKELEISINENVLQNEIIIMITEDDKMNMYISKRLLEKLCPNSKIIEARNGEEAITICKQEKVDLIFMDIQMPVIDGIEATKRIRSELKLKCPIIGLSANALKEEVGNAMQAGMNDYLTKPINKSQLRLSVIKALANKY